jgi:alkylmercury lyase
MTNQSLPRYDLQELAAPVQAIFDSAPEQFARLTALQNLLLEGQPVSQEQIASRLHMAREEVPALLQGAELDAEGNFLGFGLTLVPTPHAYQINGRQFYTWCAADAITFPILHQTSVVIASPDPVSGETIRLIGTPEGARDVTPGTAVVSWVRSPKGPTTQETIRAAFCNFVHFFASMETATQFVSSRPEVVIVPIDNVFQIGKLLWEREPFKSLLADLSQSPARE